MSMNLEESLDNIMATDDEGDGVRDQLALNMQQVLYLQFIFTRGYMHTQARTYMYTYISIM